MEEILKAGKRENWVDQKQSQHRNHGHGSIGHLMVCGNKEPLLLNANGKSE